MKHVRMVVAVAVVVAWLLAGPAIAHGVEADDQIPGVAGTSPVVGTLDAVGGTDYDDVIAITFAAGQTIDIRLQGPADADFDLYLFSPTAADIALTDDAVATSLLTDCNESITYKAAAAGTYYLDVNAFSGAGSYTLTWGDVPAGLKPIFRFRRNALGNHFYTDSTVERDDLIATLPGVWTYEGVAWYADPTNPANDDRLERFGSLTNGGHFWTASVTEYNQFLAYPGLWHYDGLAWMTAATETSGMHPVYRLWDPQYGVYLYTANEWEAMWTLLNTRHQNQGVAFYVDRNLGLQTLSSSDVAPITEVDEYDVAMNGTLDVEAPGVFDNDWHPPGAVLTASVSTAPAHGTLQLAADGSFRYTPAPGYYGQDLFWYRADIGTNSALGCVYINVTRPPTSVYRFYNLRTGVHFYSADPTEVQRITATLGYLYRLEGIAYTVNEDSIDADQYLYRFYNNATGTHFYTASDTEADWVANELWEIYDFDGEAYLVSLDPAAGRPVFRFYNVRSGVHFYTADPGERDSVIARLGWLYQYEGPAFYLPE